LARPKTKVRPRLRGGVNGNQTGARKSTARQKAGGDLARQERRGGESRWSSVTQHIFSCCTSVTQHIFRAALP
jgi:hypothetical protein